MWYKLQQHIILISLVCSWHSKYSDDIIVTNVWLLFSWLNINVHMENTLIFICTSCTRNIILAQFSEIWQAVKLSELPVEILFLIVSLLGCFCAQLQVLVCIFGRPCVCCHSSLLIILAKFLLFFITTTKLFCFYPCDQPQALAKLDFKWARKRGLLDS